jgi:hypothetical protein
LNFGALAALAIGRGQGNRELAMKSARRRVGAAAAERIWKVSVAITGLYL